MTDEVFRTARRLIDRHASGAVVEAAFRVGKMIAFNNGEAAKFWERVIWTIYELHKADRSTKH